MRKTTSKHFFGDDFESVPLYFDSIEDTQNYILNMGERIDDNEAIYYRGNYILPYIRVM